jgi:predicted nucleic acid-binding protein
MVRTVHGKVGMGNFQALIDSDAFIAWLMPDDLLHQPVSEIFGKLEKRKAALVTTSWVILETATVLSNRASQSVAKLFLDQVEKMGLSVIHITEDLQQEAVEFFKRQEARGTSLVDCGNAVIVARFNIPQIFSFDGFYTKRLKLSTVN